MAHPRTLLLAFVITIASAAQPPAPLSAPSTSRPESEALELSPFQVTAETFKGYFASQTLAGSRLKTNLDEVAAAIQIVTPEFMQDVGATSLNDLFLYTTSTESAGINGNFSNYNVGSTSTGDDSNRVNPQGSQRVRGISGADLTRNYFLTLIPSDRFNIEMTEINRGGKRHPLRPRQSRRYRQHAVDRRSLPERVSGPGGRGLRGIPARRGGREPGAGAAPTEHAAVHRAG
ncbi:MAG: hypothetical protein RLZZ188_3165 [Verrucomicrobiota bacterium]